MATLQRIRVFGIKQSLKIFSLLLFLFTLPQIAYMKTPFEDKSFLTSNKRAEKIKEVETNLPPLPLSLPYNMNNYVERPLVNACPVNYFLGHGKKKPSNIQVFINFRGVQLRRGFISFLVDALKRREINIFIDKNEQAGEDLTKLFQRIEGSGIAIVVFSSRYTESNWCLGELVKIKERAQQGLLKVLPIYYKVSIANVKKLKGEFGDYFREKEYMYKSDESKIKHWKEAIAFVSRKVALSFHETSSTLEADFVQTVVEVVLRMLQDI